MNLQTLHAKEGMAWVRQAFALFMKFPVGFLGLVCTSWLIMMLVLLVPHLGVFLTAMATPWLSLGFMQASRQALNGKVPLVSVFLEPLRSTPSRVRPLVILGVTYLSVFALIMLISAGFWDENALAAMVEKSAQNPSDLQQLMLNTEFQTALMLRLGLPALLATLFWHVPPLVYWGGQPVGRALVFSLIALWRNKVPFLIFTAAWLLVGAFMALACTLVLSLTGLNSLMPVLSMILMTVLVTVFYISTYFSFAGCFWAQSKPDPG